MRETLYKYLDLMERLNNNEFLMSPEERYEMDNFFNSSTELINLRSNLISEENPEQRRVLVEEYLKSIEKDLDKEELAASLNLKSIKDITLTYDKKAGVSSYLYIAIFVLVVAFIVFMYFIFRR